MTGVKKNFLKLTLDKSHFITETVDTAGYSKRESLGRKATDETNAEGKYS